MRQHYVHQEAVNRRAMRETDNLVADIDQRLRIKELRIGHFLDARVNESDTEKETQRYKRPFQRMSARPPMRCRHSRGCARAGHSRLRLRRWNGRCSKFPLRISGLFHRYLSLSLIHI